MRLSHKLTIFFGPLIADIMMILHRIFKSESLVDTALKFDANCNRAQGYKVDKSQDGNVIMAQILQASKLLTHINADQAQNLKSLLKDSSGQLLQDTAVQLLLNNKKSGYFVEVGVGSGVRISNTYMLETKFGWDGLLVEPNRDSHLSIKENRKAQLVKEAAYKIDDQTLLFEAMADGEYSGFADLRTNNRDDVSATYEVKTATLSTILKNHNAPHNIDYLSIDTEGSELAVIEGMDFDAWNVQTLSIEHNYDMDKKNACEAILEKHGYQEMFKGLFEYDAIYMKK